MARFTRDLVLNKPDDFVQFIMNDFLQKNQFEMSDWKGEAAYRAGDAMVEGFKYLKWSYTVSYTHLFHHKPESRFCLNGVSGIRQPVQAFDDESA